MSIFTFWSRLIVIFNLLFVFYMNLYSVDWKVTVLDNPSPGYIKFDWREDTNFYLWDNYGNKIYWDSIPDNNQSIYKYMENNTWLEFKKNSYYIYDEKMNQIGRLAPKTNYSLDKHEVTLLNNGHYILLYNERITVDMSKYAEGADTNAVLMSNVLVETDTSGTIFWEWKAYEHLPVTDVTSDIDLTQHVIDFTHINSIVEDSDGNLLVSIRHFDEIIKINRQDGSIIWRMGGSKSKNNQFEIINDTTNGFVGFSHQHCLSLLPNGNFLMYDNGNLKEPRFSRAVEYKVDQVNKTAEKVWEYRYSPDLYAASMGSVQRLPNGNTLINWGNTRITEVRADGSIAFDIKQDIDFPVVEGYIYRAYRLVTRMNAVSQNLSVIGEYDFNDEKNKTGILLSVTSISGSSDASIEKHEYLPTESNFNDSGFSMIYPYRWVLNKHGITKLSGTLKIAQDAIENIEDPAKVTIYKRNKETEGIFEKLNTNFNPETGQITADFSDLGEFVICSNVLSKPELVSPTDQSSDLKPNVLFEWEKLPGASVYNIQMAKNPLFTGNDLKDFITSENFYIAELDETNEKYYWRVSGFNDKDTSDWSEVFSFTVYSNSVNDGKGQKEFSFYPNPVSDKIFLDNKELDESVFVLYNVQGTIILKGIVRNNEIDVSHLLAGIYYASVGNIVFLFNKF
jgi:hypothetical protein